MTQRDYGIANPAINPGGQLTSDANGVVRLGGITLPSYVTDSSGNITGLVGSDGALVARFDSQVADKLTIPVEHFESTAAMSTTVTVRITPTATFRTARVSWVNNGASGTAKLNIAANCDNDVAGLVASQSALQRDAQMTMGDVRLLVSPVPITSLNFSSDGSITSDTHRLLVSFGA